MTAKVDFWFHIYKHMYTHTQNDTLSLLRLTQLILSNKRLGINITLD